MPKSTDDKYSEAEIKRRMEAALRGARIAGHKAKSQIVPKQKRAAKRPPASSKG